MSSIARHLASMKSSWSFASLAEYSKKKARDSARGKATALFHTCELLFSLYFYWWRVWGTFHFIRLLSPLFTEFIFCSVKCAVIVLLIKHFNSNSRFCFVFVFRSFFLFPKSIAGELECVNSLLSFKRHAMYLKGGRKHFNLTKRDRYTFLKLFWMKHQVCGEASGQSSIIISEINVSILLVKSLVYDTYFPHSHFVWSFVRASKDCGQSACNFVTSHLLQCIV